MTTLDVAAPGTCPCGIVASRPHTCEFRPAKVIDPATVWCPCCGEIPWCPQERSRSYAEAMNAPEIQIGTGMYPRRWNR